MYFKYSEQLEKQKRYENIRKRAQSALVRPGERFARYHSTPCPDAQGSSATKTPGGTQARPVTAPVTGRVSALSTIRGGSPEKVNATPAAFSQIPHFLTEKGGYFF
jgi:hypothetical protein